MRFRAEIKDVGALLPTLNAFHQCGHICMLVLSPEKTRLILPSEHTQGEQLYAELATDVWTDAAKVESQNNNQIPLLVHIPNIIKALKCCEKADKSTLKLSKKNQRAYLTFDTFTGDQRIMQDIPILVQQPKRVEDWEEPLLSEPRIKLTLPNMRALQALTDKMKNVSDVLDIEAASDGTMTFSVAQAQVRISAKFEGLLIKDGPQVQQSPQRINVSESPIRDDVARAIEREQAQAAGPTAMELDGQPADAAANGGAAHVPAPGVGPSVPLSALDSAMDGSNAGGLSVAPEPVETTRARVSMRKFANVTAARHIQATHVIACIVEHGAFVVYLKLKNKRGILTYYLPLIQDRVQLSDVRQ